jgi:transcriptional regulator with XRE-family HTH domain
MQRRWVVSPDYRSAIEALVTARKELGLTQREVGRRLGKPASFPNKIEKLERRLDILEFIALARAYGLDPRELLGRVMAALPEKLDF